MSGRLKLLAGAALAFGILIGVTQVGFAEDGGENLHSVLHGDMPLPVLRTGDLEGPGGVRRRG